MAKGTTSKDSYKIKVNKAQCRVCGDIIESKHRHDFVACKCDEIFVDGGKEYLRRGAKDFANLKELSITTGGDRGL
jgi:hypothetical protein